MVQRILINMSKRCWECKAELEDKTVSLKPKFCGDRCRQLAELRRAARNSRRQCGWRRDETREELVRTQESLRKAQQELEWWQQRRDPPAESDEVRWMISELTQLPGVGGSGVSDSPESIVARLRGALTEANNRAMAWERKAKAGRKDSSTQKPQAHLTSGFLEAN